MAAGSGRALADLVMGRTPGIDLAPYALDRFG
jgi:glycine/D-amino acid oxidase-like deaminating enzyme